MQQSFADGELIAGARVSTFNVVRLHKRGKAYVVSRNVSEILGAFPKLDKAVDVFERATHGATYPVNEPR